MASYPTFSSSESGESDLEEAFEDLQLEDSDEPQDVAGGQRQKGPNQELHFETFLKVSRENGLDMKNLMSHELAAVPPALFKTDGMMRKTTKSALARELESIVTKENHSPDVAGPSAYIIDAMALLQCLKGNFQTFNDLGERVLNRIFRNLSSGKQIDCVAMVFDRYDHPTSIKGQERHRRGAVEDADIAGEISGDTPLPDYRKFLSSSSNKAKLTAFVSNYITESGKHRLNEGQTIILSGGFEEADETKIIKKNSEQSLDDLMSDQEEADTRIVLHAIYLAKTYTRVIIKCEDTDVLALLLCYASCGMFGSASVLLHKGRRNKRRLVSINQIYEQLGKDLCQCLPAFHALTGCDTTSSFYFKGKKTAFKVLRENFEELKGLSQFGLTEHLEESLPIARRFALILYGEKDKMAEECASLDELRCALLEQDPDKAPKRLPPTEDSFKQHVLRAMYQTAVWRNSHQKKAKIWSPVGRGWRLKKGVMEPVMCRKTAAPQEVRRLAGVICGDNKCNQQDDCPCFGAGFPCIELCDCCTNKMY